MKKKRIPFAAAAIAVMLSLLTGGCSEKTPSSSSSVPLVLNEVAQSIFYAPQYAAIELGYFEEEGIDLTLVNAGGADKVMASLISGDAQIGFMGSEASIYVYQEGSDDPAVTAYPAGRQFPGRPGSGAGFHLGRFKREKSIRRT